MVRFEDLLARYISGGLIASIGVGAGLTCNTQCIGDDEAWLSIVWMMKHGTSVP